jgi:hypothetical protein
MKVRVLSVALGAVAAAATARLAAQAPQSQQPTKYTVDWLMTGGPMVMTMHIFRDEANQRIDMEMPTMAPGTMQLYTCPQTTVVRNDLQKVWIYTNWKKEYTEKEFPQSEKMDVTDPRQEAGKVEELGSETIDGEECTKYRLTIEGQGTMLMWTAKKTNMMKRMQREGMDGFTMEAKNLQIGAPPAGSFDLPAGYKKAGGSGGQVAKGIFSSMATGLAGAFMPNFVGGAAGMAQAKAQQAGMKEDAENMAKMCKPAQFPGMPRK